MSNSAVSPFSLGICALISLISDNNSPLSENREDLILLLQETIQSNIEVTTLSSLVHRLQRVDPECAQIWIQVLNASSESIDSLLDLTNSFQKALRHGVLDSVSQSGTFIRATCLALDEMLFDRLGILWQRYHDEIAALINGIEYIEPAKQAVPSAHSLRQACLALDNGDNSGTILDFSSKYSPEGHFLSFMQCIAEGERVGALHSLHQFVDMAMIAERKRDHDVNKKRGDVLGHAAVLLANVHAKFGEGSLHQLATEESLRVAQQSGDAASIAFAMGLLYESSGGGSPHEVLQQCTIRATGARCFSLATSANLAMAKELLARGEVKEAWREWIVATNEKPVDSTSVWTDRPVRLTTNTAQLQTQRNMVGLEMWESLGFYGMTSLLAKISLNSDCIGQFERTQLVWKSIQASMHGPDLGSSSSNCRYESALDIINTLSSHDKDFFKALIMHEWACRSGRLRDARVLLSFLHSFINPRMTNYLQARMQVGSQHALLLSRQGRFDEAKIALKGLLDICNNEDLPHERVSILLQLATNELDASSEIFTGALMPLLECLEISEKLSKDTLHATTLSILAQIYIRLSNPSSALSMLNAAIPTLRQQGHVWYFAEAHLTLGKCHLSLAKEENRRVESLNAAMQALKQASDIFHQCQDLLRLKEVYYLQARVYNVLPDQIGERNDASRRFVDLTKYMADHTMPSRSRTINEILFETDFKMQTVIETGIASY